MISRYVSPTKEEAVRDALELLLNARCYSHLILNPAREVLYEAGWTEGQVCDVIEKKVVPERWKKKSFSMQNR
jgi:hypothetical protein